MAHWSKAAQAAYRQLMASPREYLRDMAHVGLGRETERRAPERWVLDLFPALRDLPIEMGVVSYGQSGMGPYELYVLRGIASLIQPRRIFEVGTFEGATTLALANAAPDAEVLTLDLPSGSPGEGVRHETDSVDQGRTGIRFRDTRAADSIIQLVGDSRLFDFSPWYGTCDLVLIDGCHERSVVESDTANAIRLASRNGIVVWDDYIPGWPGVVAAVDALASPRVVRLANTTLAIQLPA